VIKKYNASIEVGFCIGQQFGKNGYCTEALTRILEYFKKNAGEEIRVIIGTNDLNNPASGKVFFKSGFKNEGQLNGYSESAKENVDMNKWSYML